MRPITQYEALDGTIWSSQANCQRYENMCERISAIMSRLPDVNVEGENSVPLDKDIFISVQRDLVMLFEEYGYTDRHTEWARNATVPAGHTLIGRYIDDATDAALRPIARAWRRVMCVGQDFRQYSQPYYALQT
jgi:hypothetical protein